MRRAIKGGMIALPWALLALLIWHDLRTIDFFGFDSATQAHDRAYLNFHRDLAFQGCVPRDAVIETAEARGWAWRDTDYCWSFSDVGDCLRVQVSPPLPFSTEDENAALFAFDADGCMMRDG